LKKLTDLEKEKSAVIESVNGDERFVSRITSIGLTPGCTVTVIKNEKHRPLLVYSRDTMIALNRNECENIIVKPLQEEGGAA
jgi:ferrous iron transport protein A